MTKVGNEGDSLSCTSCRFLTDLKKGFFFFLNIYHRPKIFKESYKEYRLQYSVLSVDLTQSSRK